MSTNPPPGFQTTSHPSLPARPPPPAAGNGSFAFKPRSVAAPPSYSAQPTYSSPSYPPAPYAVAPIQYQQPQQQSYGHSPIPQITNPFPLPGQAPTGGWGRSGPALSEKEQEEQAQIAQWQSAYMGSAEPSSTKNSGATATQQPIGPSKQEGKADEDVEKKKTVMRSGGGQNWQDATLLEWDPSHFRLFVGNLAGEVSDDSLFKAFQRYESVQKARVVRDKRTTKSKGFGFVSFSNMDDYSRAAKDMQGKYIGSHPVILRAAKTDVRPANVPDKQKKKGGKGGGGSGSGNAHTGAGVKKGKTKGGLKILG